MAKQMINELCPTEKDDYWLLPLEGKRVTTWMLDTGLTFCFQEAEGDLRLRIENSFTLQKAEQSYTCNPEHAPSLSPVLSLHQKIVQQAIGFKNGSLEIQFADQSIIKVSPDEQYEAWQFQGINGFLIVSLPDGGLDVWD